MAVSCRFWRWWVFAIIVYYRPGFFQLSHLISVRENISIYIYLFKMIRNLLSICKKYSINESANWSSLILINSDFMHLNIFYIKWYALLIDLRKYFARLFGFCRIHEILYCELCQRGTAVSSLHLNYSVYLFKLYKFHKDFHCYDTGGFCSIQPTLTRNCAGWLTHFKLQRTWEKKWDMFRISFLHSFVFI